MWVVIALVLIINVFIHGVSGFVFKYSFVISTILLLINFLMYMMRAFLEETSKRDKRIIILSGIVSSVNLLPCLSFLVLIACSLKQSTSGILGLIFSPIALCGLLVVLAIGLLIAEGIPIGVTYYALGEDSTSSVVLYVIGLVSSIILTYAFIKIFVFMNFPNDVLLLRNTIYYIFL